jgi:alpha-L-rhamnosidase
MNWTAKWITGYAKVDADSKVAPYCFKKDFSLKGEVKCASIYATALGMYGIYMNGEKITDRFLTPGYTEYFKRVQYQEYDVTKMLTQGKQILTAELADGWYTGRLGLVNRENMWGKKRALMVELHITYMDGSAEIISTDKSWLVSTEGPRRNASLFDGEVFDANRSIDTIHKNLFKPAKVYNRSLPEKIVPDAGVPVLLHERVRPKKIWKNSDGETLIDFGRNMAGIIEIGPFEGKHGQKITVRHAEVVMGDKLYTLNLRTAQQRIEYIAREGIQVYHPEFATMGFQYVAVTGLDVTEDNITAIEIYSDMEEIGEFSCSDERLNQFQQNVKTSLKANFVDIPMDCPQRDERCGWTGDIAVFAPTAAFIMDVNRFMNKWLEDVAIVQDCLGNGCVPSIVPSNAFTKHRLCNYWAWIYQWNDAVWGDAAVLVPWAVYQAYDDINVLKNQYDSMKAWVEYEHRESLKGKKKLIWDSGILKLGDWLAPGENSSQWKAKAKWTSTAYFANSAHIVSLVAEILGKSQDAKTYQKLYEDICAAFRNEFVGTDGHITNGFQSIYVLALMFKMLTPEQEKLCIDDLVADIRMHDNHLATGFAGTDKLLFALSDFGRTDVAYDLLMQTSFPSWLYPVTCGATSTWERWDSLTPDGKVNEVDDGPKGMVSFNHYAYGAAASWMYTRMCGLQIVKPGYKEFKIAPMPGGGITWASICRKTAYGEIKSRWDIEDDIFRLTFTVPEQTKAIVVGFDGSETVYEPGAYSVEWKIV